MVILTLALTLSARQAQTFTTLKSFGILINITGFNPQSTLVQGPDGTLYGTATYGAGLGVVAPFRGFPSSHDPVIPSSLSL
jgi:hypothetical protein